MQYLEPKNVSVQNVVEGVGTTVNNIKELKKEDPFLAGAVTSALLISFGAYIAVKSRG